MSEALKEFDNKIFVNVRDLHNKVQRDYAKGWVKLGIENMFPYNKPQSVTIQKEHQIRRCILATGLWSLFYTIFVDLVVPQEIVDIIIEYTMLYELVDEIMNHLIYFSRGEYHELMQGLWDKMVDAQLYRTVGWFPEPEPNWIRNKYFAVNGYAWRKTFAFPGTALTFAQCVTKRLYLIKSNIIHSYFVRHTMAITKFHQGIYYTIKPSKKKERTKWQHEIELIRLLRMYKNRVIWIEEVVKAICAEESKYINPNLTWKQRHEDFPMPKVIHG